MKQLLFVLLASLAMQASIAQFRKVPAAVTNAFAVKYPDAKNVEWKDNMTNFSARFISKNSTKCKATYYSKGEWQSTEEELDAAALPAPVKDGLAKSKYADREIAEVLKIEKKEGGTQYRLLAKKSGVEKKYLYFNEEGKLMKEAMTI